MKKSLIYFFLVLLLVILLAGCNLPASGGTDTNSLERTYVAQTVAAGQSGGNTNGGGGDNTSGGNGTSGDNTSGGGDNVAPSNTPIPTNTPIPSNTPIPTNTPLPTATATETVPCNRAGWVKDVTVPDGTQFAPGETFTKTWRLKNTGSCNWNNDYDLVFHTGDKMNGGDVVDITIGTVEPGETVDISVDLKAPNSPGDYHGEWLLRSDDNQVFGLGDNNVAFYVEIDVVEPVSFVVLSSSHYTCNGDTYITFRVENTGTEELESSGGNVKNLTTNGIVYYLFYDTPFTENDDDCPPMLIDNLEPGDIYYMAYNMGSASGTNYKFTIVLCTQEGGGGDCVTQTATHNLP